LPFTSFSVTNILLVEQGVDGSNILKWMSEEWAVIVHILFTWLGPTFLIYLFIYLFI